MTVNTPKIIVITGPTATGKTALGALLGKNIGGEVISADSMQIYEHMDIGTAKPTQEEMLGVPHHLYGITPPTKSYSVARYIEDAGLCINNILDAGKTPILVGGTGLYIESLISGRSFMIKGDSALRADLEKKYDEVGGEEMIRLLSIFDESSAKRLYTNDKRRIVRAFEVYEQTGKTITQHDLDSKSIPPKYDAVKYALTYRDRSVLYERINGRVDIMRESGLEDEVRALLDMGVPSDATAMQAIGYKELIFAINGETTFDEAYDKIKMESRRYAKRQLSWLRRDDTVKWITWESQPDLLNCVKEIMTNEENR